MHALAVAHTPLNYGQRLELVKDALPQGLTWHYADEAGNICSVPLCICQVALLLLIILVVFRRRGLTRRNNALHRPKPAATRQPPAGPPEAHAKFFLPHAQVV